MPPNDNGAGPNVPPVSVGPTSSTNAPGNFIMSASAWSGWPSAETPGGPWATPPMEPLGGPGIYSGFGYGRQDPGGYLHRVSTVMTCVDLNSRQLASFPAYGVKNRSPVALPSWYDGGPEPELYGDWSAFMKAATSSYWLHGETILWATDHFANGFPARFIALDPRDVHQDVEGTWYLGQDDHGRELARGDVCSIPYQRLPGVRQRRGIGPLMWAYGNILSAGVLDTYAQQIARYGVWAVLKFPQELTAEQSAELQAQWMAARLASAGAPAVLSGGLTFETLTMSPKDMALLDLVFLNLEMIAAAMGVPSVLVNLPQNTGLQYSTTMMVADQHWRATLRTAMQSFSDAMSQWLLPHGTKIEWNADRYVQPGFLERMQADEIAIRSGMMTADEGRRAERWGPMGDTSDDEIEGIL